MASNFYARYMKLFHPHLNHGMKTPADLSSHSLVFPVDQWKTERRDVIKRQCTSTRTHFDGTREDQRLNSKLLLPDRRHFLAELWSCIENRGFVESWLLSAKQNQARAPTDHRWSRARLPIKLMSLVALLFPLRRRSSRKRGKDKSPSAHRSSAFLMSKAGRESHGNYYTLLLCPCISTVLVDSTTTSFVVFKDELTTMWPAVKHHPSSMVVC